MCKKMYKKWWCSNEDNNVVKACVFRGRILNWIIKLMKKKNYAKKNFYDAFFSLAYYNYHIMLLIALKKRTHNLSSLCGFLKKLNRIYFCILATKY